MRGFSTSSFIALLLALALGLLIGRATAPAAGPFGVGPLASAGFDEARLAEILATPHLQHRSSLLLAYLDELPPEALPGVRASYARLRPNLDATAAVALMDWWARFDPEGALGFGSSFGDFSSIAISAAMRRWAQWDPIAARDALETYKASRWQPQAVVALVRGWAESGEPGAWPYVEALPMGALRQQSIAALVNHLILRDGPDATMAFVEALPDHGVNRFKLQVFRQTAAALAIRYPELATAWAERHKDGPFGDGLLYKVALSWVFLDGEGCAAWLAELPADDAQQDALRTAYGFWLRQDRERAGAWLRERGEPGPALEPAWALLALDLGQEDPHAGLEMLPDVVREGELRDKTTIALARIWVQRDPDAARAWLDASSLSEEVLHEIRTARRPKRRRSRVPAPLDAPPKPADTSS